MGVKITIEFDGEEPEESNLNDPERLHNAMMELVEHRDWKEVPGSGDVSYLVEVFPLIEDPRLQ